MMAAPPKGGGHIDFTLGEALRTRAFWMLGMGHGISVMAIMGASVNQFPHMEQGMDLARSKAAVVVTIASAMNGTPSAADMVAGKDAAAHPFKGF